MRRAGRVCHFVIGKRLDGSIECVVYLLSCFATRFAGVSDAAVSLVTSIAGYRQAAPCDMAGGGETLADSFSQRGGAVGDADGAQRNDVVDAFVRAEREQSLVRFSGSSYVEF